MEAVTKFDIDFPRIIPVESAERQAIVQLHATVCHIERGQGNGIFFSEVFPERKIERCLPRQISPWDIAQLGVPLWNPEP